MNYLLADPCEGATIRGRVPKRKMGWRCSGQSGKLPGPTEEKFVGLGRSLRCGVLACYAQSSVLRTER